MNICFDIPTQLGTDKLPALVEMTRINSGKSFAASGASPIAPFWRAYQNCAPSPHPATISQRNAKLPFLHLADTSEEATLIASRGVTLDTSINGFVFSQGVHLCLFTARIGNEGFAFSFDANLPEIRKALARWAKRGSVPVLLRCQGSLAVRNLPIALPDGFNRFLRGAAISPATVSDDRIALNRWLFSELLNQRELIGCNATTYRVLVSGNSEQGARDSKSSTDTPTENHAGTQNPYFGALELIQRHVGTSGQMALAKCILSLYNAEHSFSIREILAPLDGEFTALVEAMVSDYGRYGETRELRQVGEYVYGNFSGLVKQSEVMYQARSLLLGRWERESEEARRLTYPE